MYPPATIHKETSLQVNAKGQAGSTQLFFILFSQPIWNKNISRHLKKLGGVPLRPETVSWPALLPSCCLRGAWTSDASEREAPAGKTGKAKDGDEGGKSSPNSRSRRT